MTKTVLAMGICLWSTAILAFAQTDETGGKSREELAAEIERLRAVMMEEQQVIADVMKRIDTLEATKTAQDKAGLNNIKLNGDFRYRYEYIHQDPETYSLVGARGIFGPAREIDSRGRHRIRLRLGVEWLVNDEISAIGRVATTMNGDNVSTNQTLDDAFAKKDLWLDAAYLDYHPRKVPGLKALAGKMNNPFYTPGKTQMIWDQDLTPEGLALTYTNTMEASPTGPVFREVPWEFGAAAGYFLVDERAIDVDAVLYGFQGTVKRNFVPDGSTSLMMGLSYYDFANVKGYPPLFSATDNFGNALSRAILNNTALYENDFNIFETFTEFSVPVFKRPLSLYGDFALNTAHIGKSFDDGNSGTAWALGLSYGRCVTPRSWALRYEYRHVGRDAVVGAFTDSDFGGGGTNSKGHIFGAEYMLLKNTRLALTYFANDNMGSDWLRLLPVFGGRENVDGPYQRLQLDFNVKF
jgi:hypothetical protein